MHSSKMKMEDRVSNLPDEILCHILSFLPTKESIATSVLSKRWKPLWRSVLALDFDDSSYGGSVELHSRFVQSVYAVILPRDSHQPIKKFRLRCSSRPSKFDSDYASIWVDAALQRRVEHLDISFPCWRLSVNLSSIFSCRTLVVLKLEGVQSNPVSSVDLPSLKVLHLRSMHLNRGWFADLLSGCPVLEDLKCYARIGEYVTDRKLNTLPKLVRADIQLFRTDFIMMRVVNNVQSLRIDQIYKRLPYGRLVETFHNLIHFELVYHDHGNYNSDWLELVEFLKYFPKLQVLVISQPQFHHFNLDKLRVRDWQCPQPVPECILSHLKRCYLNDYRGTEGEFQFAKYIMQNGRFLKKMTICSSAAGNEQGKLNNMQKLSSCTRCSATCNLSFK